MSPFLHAQGTPRKKAASQCEAEKKVTSWFAATNHDVTFSLAKAVGISAARAGVLKFLSGFTILPIDRQTLLDADAMAGSDLEDNILIAAAVSASLDAIITRNLADFSHSPIPVWEPSELLKRRGAAVRPRNGRQSAAGPALSGAL